MKEDTQNCLFSSSGFPVSPNNPQQQCSPPGRALFGKVRYRQATPGDRGLVKGGFKGYHVCCRVRRGTVTAIHLASASTALVLASRLVQSWSPIQCQW